MGNGYCTQQHDSSLLWFLLAAVFLVWVYRAILRFLSMGALPFESDDDAYARRQRDRSRFSYGR